MAIKEKDISIIRGDTEGLFFTLTSKGNVPIMGITEEIYWTMKKSYKASEAILQKKWSDGDILFTANGQGQIILEHDDTAQLPYGTYVYDIQFKSKDYVCTVIEGELELTDESTHKINE
jgi:hypothetical protein